MYKNRWCVRICEEWQAERENKLVTFEDEKQEKILSEYDWCEFDNHMQRNIAAGQLTQVFK